MMFTPAKLKLSNEELMTVKIAQEILFNVADATEGSLDYEACNYNADKAESYLWDFLTAYEDKRVTEKEDE